MSGNSPLNTSSGSLSAKRVGEWATDVHLFFSEEWTRLRALIMSIEEDGWNEKAPASDTRAPALCADSLSQSETTGNWILNQSDEHQLDEQDADEDNRLSELERRIEQRLRMTSAGRR